MKRKVRSDTILQRSSDHLAYEIWMLDSLARELKSWPHGKGALQCGVLEAFTVHARALLDFFYLPEPNRPLHPDDVIAEDYFHENRARWLKLRPPKTVILERVNDRVNKEIGHLTYGRLNVLQVMKEWSVLQIRDDILKIVDTFLRAVPGSRVGTKLGGFAYPAQPLQPVLPGATVQTWSTSMH